MPSVRQTSFAGGELAPALYGRTDFARYHIALRRARNFFINQEGSAVSRPGTKFVREVKDSTRKVRLVPYVYSDSETYVLEFGHLYVRFHTNGGTVLSGGVPYEVATPYVEADLAKLKFAQVGAVLTICHASYAPRELRRTTAVQPDWTLSTVSFAVWPFETVGGLEPYIDGDLHAADAEHPEREWVFKITNLVETTDGARRETLPWTVDTYKTSTGTFLALPVEVVLFADRALRVNWTHGAAAGVTFLAWRLYRGRGTSFGYVGETTTYEFMDIGVEPDVAVQPPTGRNPFEVKNPSGGLLRTENPAVVSFFEQRRVFANGNHGGIAYRPGFLWGSRTDDYYNFDTPFPSTPDNAVEFELASTRLEEIRSLVPLDRLLCFTGSSVWSIGGAGGDPLHAASVDAKVHSSVGASWLDPILVGDIPLYVRARGGVQELRFANERGKYLSSDISVMSRHLFLGRSIVDWAYAREPYSLVWAVRDDGKLLSLSYVPEQQLVAWAWHDTTGTVEAVCTAPEGAEDAVYMVVRRTLGGVQKRYLERMTSRLISDVTQAVCLDCAATYSGSPATVISGLDHLEGLEVYALADGQVFGPLTVTGGEVTLELEDGASLVHVGLQYTPELEGLNLAGGEDARSRQKTVTKVTVEVEASRGLWVGESLEALTEWRQRRVSQGYGAMPLETAEAEVRVTGKWGTGGRWALRQQDPLPLTVLSVAREVEFGGS